MADERSPARTAANAAWFDATFQPHADPASSPSAHAKPPMPTWQGRGVVAPSPPTSTARTADPRPDLRGDTALWSALLARADTHDGTDPAGLFGLLHGLRCLGAALQARPDRLYLLAGQIDAEEWRTAYLPRLAARRDAVVTLLTEARE